MIKKFQEVREYLADIDSINAGGCGVAALAMMMWLEKTGADMTKFYLVLRHSYRERDTFQTNLTFLHKGVGNADACAHYLIHWKGEYMDSMDRGNKGMMSHAPYELKVAHPECFKLVCSALQNGMWNPRFDREDECPRIEEALGITFPEGVYFK